MLPGAERSILRGITLGSIAAILVIPMPLLRAQSPQVATRPNVRLPDEAAGLDAVASALIGAFDQTDIVALGEGHNRQVDSDLRIALVRHPDFAKNVRTIVIEYASPSEQSTLDRYIRGENVSRAQLEQVWKTTAAGANGLGEHPVYADFLSAIREVNSKLPADARIRVLAGDPRTREIPAFSVLKEEVRQRHGKALLIYGAAHFFLTGPAEYLASLGDGIGLARRLDIDHPGRWLSVIPIGALARPSAIKETDIEPDYRKFDRALTTRLRPVLVSFQRLPFRDFAAEEFLGRTLITCRPPGGCRSVFKASTLTLGQMADAGVYFGRDASAAGERSQRTSPQRSRDPERQPNER
jgi:hypothetical protein